MVFYDVLLGIVNNNSRILILATTDNPWKLNTVRLRNYSCADIDVVCREAALTPIRRFGSATHFDNVQNQQTYGSCHRSLDHSHRYSDSQQITYPVTMEDILAAIATQNPAINRYDLLRYESFA
ncbi:unnamed protein product [Rotaria sp. Silwood1]|nr:unnamed protein product [Rotaria sp. Silwood1]